MFCSTPRVGPHVPHILWIDYEEIGMTGFVRDGFGRIPKRGVIEGLGG